MKEFVFKMVALIGALFILFLWQGGVWTYSEQSDSIRHNKITGETQMWEDGIWKDEDALIERAEMFNSMPSAAQ